MAIQVKQSVFWRAGEGTPVKYQFIIDALTDIILQTETQITLSLKGTITVINHPLNSRNTWPASDFAVLTTSDKDPADHQFSKGTSYYRQGLPFLPNAPQDYLNSMIAEFRGDTYINDGNNRASLWTKDGGVVINAIDTETSRTVNIDTTYTVNLTGAHDQPVLIWQTSGANNSTDYSWLHRQVWVSLVDFDYRPGYLKNPSAAHLSHNRKGGAANVLTSAGEWRTMRTKRGAKEGGDPPTILHPNGFLNMRKFE